MPAQKIALTVAGVVGLGLAACYVLNPLQLTVSGYGEVEAVADTAVIAFTVADTNPSPAIAQLNLENKANSMKTVLTDNGFDETEIIMSQPTLVPTQTGYQASMSMGGKTNRIQDVQVLVALLYERGAVYVSQPVMSVAEPGAYQKQAFDAAVDDAQNRMKNSGKAKLFRKLVAVAETADQPVQSTLTTQGTGQASEGQEGQVPVSQDTIKITKNVLTTYRVW